ncbi:MAG TPA: hypothetical protein PLL75_07500 [Candidatus Omnitrophota bacterium]|mgnify:CR=1 FL=1|nr:hypothetical protein [Candidatus Omnitrophota bacterium]HPS37551.1 hypothetical protein [Candidatus Omnitrophota bacterium]
MAQPDASLTPEKRLLELIEEPDAHKKDVAEGPKKAARANLFSLGVLRDRIAGLKARAGDVFKRYRTSFGIRELNRVLKWIVIILGVVFVVDFTGGLARLKQDFAKSIEIPPNKVFETPSAEEATEESTGMENWDLAKMFMPYGKRQAEAERLVKEQSSRLVEMTKKLKLTGISYDPVDPKSAFCMIEDIEKSITTFLRVGDPIGLLKVAKIQEDYVVLESGNETFELR